MSSGRHKRDGSKNRNKIVVMWNRLPAKAKEIIIGLIIGYIVFKIMLKSGILS